MSQYAYVAAHPDMPGYYAVASADPKYIKDIGTDIEEWEKDGSVISLVTVEEARDGMQVYWDAKKAKKAAQLPEIKDSEIPPMPKVKPARKPCEYCGK